MPTSVGTACSGHAPPHAEGVEAGQAPAGPLGAAAPGTLPDLPDFVVAAAPCSITAALVKYTPLDPICGHDQFSTGISTVHVDESFPATLPPEHYVFMAPGNTYLVEQTGLAGLPHSVAYKWAKALLDDLEPHIAVNICTVVYPDGGPPQHMRICDGRMRITIRDNSLGDATVMEWVQQLCSAYPPFYVPIYTCGSILSAVDATQPVPLGFPTLYKGPSCKGTMFDKPSIHETGFVSRLVHAYSPLFVGMDDAQCRVSLLKIGQHIRTQVGTPDRVRWVQSMEFDPEHTAKPFIKEDLHGHAAYLPNLSAGTVRMILLDPSRRDRVLAFAHPWSKSSPRRPGTVEVPTSMFDSILLPKERAAALGPSITITFDVPFNIASFSIDITSPHFLQVPHASLCHTSPHATHTPRALAPFLPCCTAHTGWSHNAAVAAVCSSGLQKPYHARIDAPAYARCPQVHYVGLESASRGASSQRGMRLHADAPRGNSHMLTAAEKFDLVDSLVRALEPVQRDPGTTPNFSHFFHGGDSVASCIQFVVDARPPNNATGQPRHPLTPQPHMSHHLLGTLLAVGRPQPVARRARSSMYVPMPTIYLTLCPVAGRAQFKVRNPKHVAALRALQTVPVFINGVVRPGRFINIDHSTNTGASLVPITAHLPPPPREAGPRAQPGRARPEAAACYGNARNALSTHCVMPNFPQ